MVAVQVLKETLRLYPTAGIGFTKEAPHGCVLSGYHIPQGATLWVSLHQDCYNYCLCVTPLSSRELHMYLVDGLNSLMIQTLLIQIDLIQAIPSMPLFIHVLLFAALEICPLYD